MAGQIARIGELEEWQDERFAEMDAAVEIHGRRHKGIIRKRRRETLRRVPSLSEALEKSSDQIILLEGEPGSGKSVALRHVAVRMASKVKNHPSETGVIPIYLNLKEFRPSAAVDVGAVRDFVWASINRANDRNVERFLDQEFDRGIEEGTWLFLFDSFDEIPAVLGAVEADDVIALYANALYDFLTGMSACRGIIASREFRGPKQVSLPRFRILRLTHKQRRDLIEKLDLSREAERQLLIGLTVSDPAVRALAENPLFLALLCEYQRGEEQFPGSSHVVFENYVAKRFLNDTKRLMDRFGMRASDVRLVAEQAAYCMASQPGLGLSPTRDALLDSIRLAGFDVDMETTVALDALDYLRLARIEGFTRVSANCFTFAHRRFQEYFATCLVMREGSRVDSLSLLTNGRWRETAVTLFQTQDASSIQPMLRQAERLLTGMTAEADISKIDENVAAEGSSKCPSADLNAETQKIIFEWPPGALHLLGILQDSFPSSDGNRSRIAENMAGRLLALAMKHGQLHDRRWAVESCLAAEADMAWDVLRTAFKSGSAWLREAAYAQAGRLDRIPDDLRQQMRTVLAGLATGGRLRQQRIAIDAQLQRLPDSRPERHLEQLFLIAPFVDAVLCAALGVITVAANDWYWRSAIITAGLVIITHFGFYVDRSARYIDAEARYSGSLAWLYGFMEAASGRIRVNSISRLGFFIRSLGLLILMAGLLTAALWTYWIIAVLWLAFLLVLTWGLAANRADRIMNNPALAKSIVLPLVWLINSGDRILEKLRRLLKMLPVALPAALKMLPAALKKLPIALRKLRTVRGALIFLFCAGITYLIFAAGTNILTGAFYNYLSYPFVAADIAWVTWLVFYGPYKMARNLLRLLSDRRLMDNIDSGTVSYTSFADMLDVLSLFRTERALLLFIQNAKRRRVPMEHIPALRALQSFAILSQPGTSTQILPAAITTHMNSDDLRKVQRWIEHQTKEKRKVIVSQAILDEIGKIVAETELNRARGTIAQE